MSLQNELIRLDAVEAVARLKRREIRPTELVEAAIARIEAVDDRVNALPIRCFERAVDNARRLETGGSREVGDHPAWLAGLPIAIKDLVDVEGVRTTYGCPLYADNVARSSDVMVRLLESRGAVVAAKSNTPEFGMLPVTDNRIFGATRTPWNLHRTAGGSSGGAAAAVASGQVWLAHGSDIGGSLRIPAACCGVVGMRPSPGRVPRMPSKRGFSPMSVQGPMARSVADIALFLDAMSAWSLHDPLTLPEDPGQFSRAVVRARPPARVAFTEDFGLARADPEVAQVARAAVTRFADAGAIVENACPDMGDVGETFIALIAMNLLTERREFLRDNRDRLEPIQGAVLDEAERMDIDRLIRAERARSELFERFARFFDDWDVLVSPTILEPPFEVNRRGVPEVDGWAGGTPPAWFSPCWSTVPTSCPIVSILAGTTAEGLPVGVQVITPVRRDDLALAAARVLEDALAVRGRLPLDP